jgi:hypothetical protein
VISHGQQGAVAESDRGFGCKNADALPGDAENPAELSMHRKLSTDSQVLRKLSNIGGTYSGGNPSYSCHICKARVVVEECQVSDAGWAIPVLGNNHLSGATVGGFGIVHFVAIEKHNHVGILF